MSSNFTGVTFANQRTTPSYDAIIRRAVLPDGILTGCELSYSGSTLTMAAGQLMICGRQVQHPAAQNWAVVDATSGYARLLLTIDLSRTATKEVFDQVVDTIEYATAVDGFPVLEQTDINGAGTRYQVVACVVSLGAGGITGIVSRIGPSAAVGDYNYLNNSDFLHFIAQAGIGGKHGTQAYAGDRWILDSGEVAGAENANGDGYTGITLNGTIRQIVADPPTGNCVCGVEMVSGTADISYANGEVTITSAGGVIKSAGLYTGKILPKYVPKGYAAELLECQRYVRRYSSASTLVAFTGGSNNQYAYIFIPFSVPMREAVKPTFEYSNIDIYDYKMNSNVAINSVDVSFPDGNNAALIRLMHDKNAIEASTPVAMRILGNGYISFFADL